jgi:hypothetical protein
MKHSEDRRTISSSNSSIVSDREDADDASVDSISTYDSTDDTIWYSKVLLRMVPRSTSRAPFQPAADTNLTLMRVPGCKRALSQPGVQTVRQHLEGTVKRQKLCHEPYSDGLPQSQEAYHVQNIRQEEATAELVNATKTFYSPTTMAIDACALSIAPLLEQAIGMQEPERKSQLSKADLSESSEEDFPQPGHGAVHPVNDLESNQTVHVIQSHLKAKPTMSFREALEPSIKPR